MLCDECGKREATYHSIKKINGETTERHLCSECQKKLGSGFMKMSGLNNLFGTLSGFFDEPRLQKREEYICSACGTTGNEFLHSGFVGCSECYKEFAPLIMPVIKRMQGDVSHVGKVPLGVENSVSAEYERLKKELDKAIELEEYEQASIIRDRMRQLKEE
ncbi:MAG: hypothetical protein HFE47_01915 [Clostridia bacterium]|nr:hypothetical protein [Clostridia bacterium]